MTELVKGLWPSRVERMGYCVRYIWEGGRWV